jgi:hypothetical protein
MPRALREILNEFNDHVLEATKGKEGTDLKAIIKGVVDELQGVSHTVYQAIFDKGHGVATAALESDKGSLTAQLTAKDGEITTLKTRIETLTKEKPDVAKMEQEHQTAMATLKAQHKTELDTLKQTNQTTMEDRDRADLERTLVAAGVEPKYARVTARDPDVTKRLKYKDGKLSVLQKDGVLPFDAPEGKTGMDLLVAEIVKDTDPMFILSNADRGSDTGQSGNRGGGGTGFFDRLREDVKKEHSGSERGKDFKTGAERLGGRPLSAT